LVLENGETQKFPEFLKPPEMGFSPGGKPPKEMGLFGFGKWGIW